MRSRRVWRETIVASAGRSSRAVTISDQPFQFVIPAEPRQRREPESITTTSGYGFRARGLRPRPGMTSQNLRGLVFVRGSEIELPDLPDTMADVLRVSGLGLFRGKSSRVG